MTGTVLYPIDISRYLVSRPLVTLRVHGFSTPFFAAATPSVCYGLSTLYITGEKLAGPNLKPNGAIFLCPHGKPELKQYQDGRFIVLHSKSEDKTNIWYSGEELLIYQFGAFACPIRHSLPRLIHE
ncbi:hypothetical protein CISG_09230 [Coccidioides immitis RMSCC 3703]|nr:hypothetical protein CIRG_00606 [Coccidioides immitis RMSCC 2394]KMU81617.1 hypothetical protein CISG_09230 [Coccidioides immitis RMSCC 3703]